jgi:hypothetical protein
MHHAASATWLLPPDYVLYSALIATYSALKSQVQTVAA